MNWHNYFDDFCTFHCNIVILLHYYLNIIITLTRFCFLFTHNVIVVVEIVIRATFLLKLLLLFVAAFADI